MNSAGRKKRYKELLDQGGEIRLATEVEDNVVTITKISNIIRETDKLNAVGEVKEHADNTTEVVMDAQVIQMSHELIGEVMKKMGNSEFCEEEWINKINCLTYTNENEESFDKIAKFAASISNTFKCSPCLFGAFDLEPNTDIVKKDRQRRQQNTSHAELRPENVATANTNENNQQNAVTTTYKQITELYLKNNRNNIPFYQFIIDPKDFMKTVDNAFKIAFLARDKSIAIETGSDNLPYIRPLTKQDKANSSNDTIQAICSLNPKLIQDMIKKYKITKPLIN